MKTRILLALGLVATGTLATLRALPQRARRKREKTQYDAEISTWEGEGGSLDTTPPREVDVQRAAVEPVTP